MKQLLKMVVMVLSISLNPYAADLLKAEMIKELETITFLIICTMIPRLTPGKNIGEPLDPMIGMEKISFYYKRQSPGILNF